MKKTPFAIAALCGLASVSLVGAQNDAPHSPPKVMQIFREMVKPGHAAAHATLEAGWPAAFSKANAPGNYIALTSVTGPNEAWFITGYDSFDAYEKDSQGIEANAALQAETDRLSAADGDHLSNASAVLAVYREDLSYRPTVNIPEMRMFEVLTARVKPGRVAEFVAARKLIQAAHEKQNMDEHWATYQVVSGMNAGTFLLFLPHKSMAALDAAQEMHGAAYEAAMGEETYKKISDLQNASLENSTMTLLRFSPKMSYPPKAWAVADAFWAPAVVKADAKMTATKKKAN
jgi:hypothetical protein